jgi:hypothetical protein
MMYKARNFVQSAKETMEEVLVNYQYLVFHLNKSTPYQKIMRNDICTTILIQLFDNFLTHIHMMLLFYLPFSLSIVFDQ